MLRTLIDANPEFVKIVCDEDEQQLVVHVDRSKIAGSGKLVLEHLLVRLHIWRSTADVAACRKFFENLTKPDAQFLEWKRIMLIARPTKTIFVQPNTFLVDGDVLKDYEPTVQGMIQSWAERVLRAIADLQQYDST